MQIGRLLRLLSLCKEISRALRIALIALHCGLVLW